MIYSFGIDLPYEHKKIDFVYDTFRKREIISIYKTILEMEKIVTKPNSLIVVPIDEIILKNLKRILDHIRLSKNEYLAKSYIFLNILDDTLLDNIDEYIEFHDNYKLQIMSPDEYPITPNENVDKLDYSKIVQLIGNEPTQQYGGRHDLSNHWGAYRLFLSCQFLSNKSQKIDELDQLKIELSKDLFFKKIILLENIQKPVKFKNYLDRLYNLINRYDTFKILIIEDQLRFFDSESGWQSVYQTIFNHPKIKLEFIDNQNDAEKINPYEFHLVLLDLRLEEKSSNPDDIFYVDNLSGIQVLKSLKKKDPSIPIIFTTASNKSWSIKGTIDFGADGYWIKESPELQSNIDYSVQNTNALFKQICDVIENYKGTRNLIQKATQIKNLVEEKFGNYYSTSVTNKCNSFIGLIHKSYSSYIEDLTNNSRIQLAFLEIMSIMNDILSFCVKDDQIIINDSDPIDLDVDDYGNYNEKNAMYEIQELLGIRRHRDFKRLYKIRNSLNIIHGRYDITQVGDTQEINPEMKDIENLINIYLEIFRRIKITQ